MRFADTIPRNACVRAQCAEWFATSKSCDAIWRDAFALHLLHQRGKAVSKVVKCGAGKMGGAGGQKPIKKHRQGPAAAGEARSAGEAGLIRKCCNLGDQQDAGQKPCAAVPAGTPPPAAACVGC